MFDNIEVMQKKGQENMDLTVKSMEVVSKGMQDISKEVADFSKKSFDDSSAAMEKIVASKSVEKAIEAQTEFAKSSYEAFVAQATKMGEMYTGVAKEAYKPFENMFAQAGK